MTVIIEKKWKWWQKLIGFVRQLLPGKWKRISDVGADAGLYPSQKIGVGGYIDKSNTWGREESPITGYDSFDERGESNEQQDSPGVVMWDDTDAQKTGMSLAQYKRHLDARSKQ